MTSHRDLFAALLAPFDADEVKLRTQAGRQLYYVTARTVMNRLDDVLGPENWWDIYQPREHSVTCELTIRLPDGTTLTKCDAGGNAGMSDPGDDDKSGFADAFKRAAVKFGVGRYLYRDGIPRFARDVLKGRAEPPAAPPPERNGHANGNGHAAAPAKRRSDWQAADHGEAARPPRDRDSGGRRDEPRADDEAPRTGRALCARLKDLDERHDYGVFKRVDAWGRAQGLGERIVDWDRADVAAAWGEAQSYLEALDRSDSLQAADDGY